MRTDLDRYRICRLLGRLLGEGGTKKGRQVGAPDESNPLIKLSYMKNVDFFGLQSCGRKFVPHGRFQAFCGFIQESGILWEINRTITDPPFSFLTQGSFISLEG